MWLRLIRLDLQNTSKIYPKYTHPILYSTVHSLEACAWYVNTAAQPFLVKLYFQISWNSWGSPIPVCTVSSDCPQQWPTLLGWTGAEAPAISHVAGWEQITATKETNLVTGLVITTFFWPNSVSSNMSLLWATAMRTNHVYHPCDLDF